LRHSSNVVRCRAHWPRCLSSKWAWRTASPDYWGCNLHNACRCELIAKFLATCILSILAFVTALHATAYVRTVRAYCAVLYWLQRQYQKCRQLTSESNRSTSRTPHNFYYSLLLPHLHLCRSPMIVRVLRLQATIQIQQAADTANYARTEEFASTGFAHSVNCAIAVSPVLSCEPLWRGRPHTATAECESRSLVLSQQRLYSCIVHGLRPKSPYEMCGRVLPSLSELRTFGYWVHVRPTTARYGRLVPNTRTVIFLGYSCSLKTVYYFDVGSSIVKMATHARFNKGMNDLSEPRPDAWLLHNMSNSGGIVPPDSLWGIPEGLPQGAVANNTQPSPRMVCGNKIPYIGRSVHVIWILTAVHVEVELHFLQYLQ
jgi:hypothetical protein